MIIDDSRLKVLDDNLIKVSNIKNFLVDIPTLHPDSPKYQKLWSEYTKYCIEGFWGRDFEGFRFMPPTLFFYGNFCKILHIDERKKVRKYIKPSVRDIDWEIHYSYIEAQGFSGFAEDEKYSCDYRILDSDLEINSETHHLFDLNGKKKTFIHPRKYLRKVHNKQLGKPLYENIAKNLLIFGTRGGGKSYTVAGISTQILTFDSIKEFTKEMLDKPPTATICIGSGSTDKSSDLIAKVVDNLNLFGTDGELGVWGEVGKDDYTPNPFYRDWVGSTLPGNKSKNPFRYEYEIQTAAGWVTEGTGTSMYHVNYSDKKQGGAEAAAGGRYILTVYEEVGLQPNFIEALLSNIATVTGEGGQFGVQLGLGTSGNIELVQQSKKVFNSPSEYNFLEFDDIWEDTGKIGLFIPCYLSDTKFKDENGNTDLEKALKHYFQRRKDAAEKSDPELLRMERMNYPIFPSDMWLSRKGHYFPIVELIERERELVKDNEYQKNHRKVKLIWDSKMPYGVRSEYDPEAEPFYEFPYTRSMSSIEGAIVIYEEPNYIKGSIPEDMYIFTLDPYVAENIEDGESLGVLKGFLNPKYTKEGYNGNMLVCTYIGKHPNGKDAFYENVEKILAYYGNPVRGLWYEANRGDSVRDYFIRKNKLYLLALRPNRARGKQTYDRAVTEFGFLVPNKITKIDMIGDTSEWLLSKTVYNGQQKRVVETYPCIFTIRQMIGFTLDESDNFDAVSALIGYPLALKELEHKFLDEVEKKKHNPVLFLSSNKRVFKQPVQNDQIPN